MIPPKIALKTILVVGIGGLLFSGYLSYQELFVDKCSFGCDGGEIFGVPVCVYGFAMYFCIVVVSALGLFGGSQSGQSSKSGE